MNKNMMTLFSKYQMFVDKLCEMITEYSSLSDKFYIKGELELSSAYIKVAKELLEVTESFNYEISNILKRELNKEDIYDNYYS